MTVDVRTRTPGSLGLVKVDTTAGGPNDEVEPAQEANTIRDDLIAHANAINANIPEFVFDSSGGNDPANNIWNTFAGAHAAAFASGGGRIIFRQNETVPAAGGPWNMLGGKIKFGGDRGVVGFPPPPQVIVTIEDGAVVQDLTDFDFVIVQSEPGGVGSPPLTYTQNGFWSINASALSRGAGGVALIDIPNGTNHFIVLETFGLITNDNGVVIEQAAGSFAFYLLFGGVLSDNVIDGSGAAQGQFLTAGSNSGFTQPIPGWVLGSAVDAATIAGIPVPVVRYDGVNDPENAQYALFGDAYDAIQAAGGRGRIRWELPGSTVFPPQFYNCTGMELAGYQYAPTPNPNCADGLQLYQPRRISRMIILPGGALTTSPVIMMNNDNSLLELHDVELRPRAPATRDALAIENPGSNPIVTVRCTGQCLIGNGASPVVNIAANATLNLILSDGSQLTAGAIVGGAGSTLNIIYEGAAPQASLAQSVPSVVETRLGNVSTLASTSGLPKQILVGDWGAPVVAAGTATVGVPTAVPGSSNGAVEDGVSVTVDNPSAGARVEIPILNLPSPLPPRFRLRLLLSTGPVATPQPYTVSFGAVDAGGTRFWGFASEIDNSASAKTAAILEIISAVINSTWNLPTQTLGATVVATIDVEWKGVPFTSPIQVQVDARVENGLNTTVPAVEAKTYSYTGTPSASWVGQSFSQLLLSLAFPVADPGTFPFTMLARVEAHPKDI